MTEQHMLSSECITPPLALLVMLASCASEEAGGSLCSPWLVMEKGRAVWRPSINKRGKSTLL